MSKLIVLIGVLNSGKGYRAERFIEDNKRFNNEMCHVNFADEVREMAWAILSWRPKNNKEYENFKNNEIWLNPTFVYYMKTTCKITGRQFLQNLGTRAVRNKYPNFWADCWLNGFKKAISEGKHVITSDLRFPNELKYTLGLKKDLMFISDIDKKFIFCDYPSENYNATDPDISERLAQRILADSFEDGQVIPEDYLTNLLNDKRFIAQFEKVC